MEKPKYRGGCKKSEQREDKRDQGSLEEFLRKDFPLPPCKQKLIVSGLEFTALHHRDLTRLVDYLSLWSQNALTGSCMSGKHYGNFSALGALQEYINTTLAIQLNLKLNYCPTQ